jgi:uncharacterized LabA/DUF88 family protein
LIFKNSQRYFENGKVVFKGNVDVELSVKTIVEMDNYDRAIIVTGDGDFHYLIEYLALKGKLYKVIIPNKLRFSSLLREFGPSLEYLDNMRMKIERKGRAIPQSG